MEQEVLMEDFARIQIHGNPTRTDGDGMENTDEQDKSKMENSNLAEKILGINHRSELLRDKFIYNPEDFKNSITKPPKITGTVIQLRPAPKLVRTPKFDQNLNALHSKEPKFVPYEPYKGAVRPMVPHEKIIHKKKPKKPSTSSLPEQKPDERKSIESVVSEPSTKTLDQPRIARDDNFEKELERLQKENQQLENQLKFQIQVNGDLKNLLVASVGEDMQTRVHILTEDKLHLARALLSSAQTLSTHQEQTEWLAGQCEVWRSKFLASSIMVEELAKWKALLSRRVQDLQDIMRRLLEERWKVRECLNSTYRDLRAACDAEVAAPRSSNVLDLSDANMQLSTQVRVQVRGNTPVDTMSWDAGCQRATTRAEALAIELIKHPVPELENADAAYSAVLGAAVALSNTFSPACCGQCTGQIKTI